MPKFGTKSREKLNQCDSRLIEIFEEVIKHIDCSIIEGHRDQETQDEYFRTGKSRLKYPDGKHNSTPSKAVDAIMYPIDWNDWNRHYFFVGFVLAMAKSKGYKLRSGLDWNMNNNFKDQNFNDAPHFEIVD